MQQGDNRLIAALLVVLHMWGAAAAPIKPLLYPTFCYPSAGTKEPHLPAACRTETPYPRGSRPCGGAHFFDPLIYCQFGQQKKTRLNLVHNVTIVLQHQNAIAILW